MSTSLSIHPQSGYAKGDLAFSTDRPHDTDNANVLTLVFKSAEFNARVLGSVPNFTVDNKISVFNLSDTDAEMLSTIGLLDDERREKLLPILRDLMNDQTTDAEIELEQVLEDADASL